MDAAGYPRPDVGQMPLPGLDILARTYCFKHTSGPFKENGECRAGDAASLPTEARALRIFPYGEGQGPGAGIGRHC